eukprot:1764523-Heterocapsa_arctica.AAC.1
MALMVHEHGADRSVAAEIQSSLRPWPTIIHSRCPGSPVHANASSPTSCNGVMRGQGPVTSDSH